MRIVLVLILFSIPKINFGQVTTINNGTDIIVTAGLNIMLEGNLINTSDGAVTNNGTLLISENVTNNASTTLFSSGLGTVEFTGIAQQQINGTGSINFYDLTNSNSSTGILLATNITVSNNLTLNDGDINLNGNSIDLLATGNLVNETNDKRVYGTTGTIKTTRVLNAPTSQNVAGLGAELTSLANFGSTTLERGHSVQTGNGNQSILRNYTITPTNNSGLDATLRFYYLDNNELNGQNESNLSTAWRSIDGGSTWSYYSATPNASNDYVEIINIDAFSMWTISDDSNPLPITLTFFNGLRTENGEIELTWTTSSEISNDFFTIQRSSDKFDFYMLAEIDGAGDSHEEIEYSFIDKLPLNGVNYYRLKQTDYDGSFEYSDILRISENRFSQKVIVYPNPTSNKIIVEGGTIVAIYNALGQVRVIKKRTEPLKMIDLKNMFPGIYYVDILTSYGTIVTKRIAKQ